MSVAEFVAALLGPCLIAVALAILVNGRAFRALLAEVAQDRGIVFLAGLIAIAIGASLVKLHNVWVLDWPLLVTLFGWAALTGGFVRVIWPEVAAGMARRFAGSETAINVVAVFGLFVGAALVNFGFH